MSSHLALPTPITSVRGAAPGLASARVAVYSAPGEPPHVDELTDADPAVLIEELCDAVCERTRLPGPAVREVIENLIHAGFADALVSVLDGGHTLRVSDHGPGIADPQRALTPGVTSAGPEVLGIVRGVGGGLPLAHELMATHGGRLEIAENLGGGASVTLSLPSPAPTGAPPAQGCSETARTILALLLEVGSATPQDLARELGRSRSECGRELVALQHRGLVSRDPSGARRLTEAGTSLVATLF
jgi:hypothetical protein